MTKEGLVWGFVRTAGTAALEVGWTALHLRRSVEQRRKPMGPTEAAQWLKLFYEDRRQEDLGEFSVDGQIPALGQLVAAGFWFTVYSLETARGRRVLKISHEHQPWSGQPSPASEDFFEHYQENLARQRSIYSSRLPHLILPQEARFVHNGRRGATLIVQPYIPHGKRVPDFQALAPPDQKKIIDEYDAFIDLTRRLRTEGLQPDLVLDRLVRENHNLVIAQMADGYYLVLLDNGAIDLRRKKAPLLNMVAPLTADLTSERARLRRIHGDNNNGHR
ncbi:hypothetical protein HYT17_03450 [Candidatus Microgenomates bacterium]|nr:hypothetical protein [Candidatus Microgenomates bacterium]